MADKYQNYAALAVGEKSTAFSITPNDRHSSVVIAAPHGGGIEPGTSEIARAIAADDLSYYLFEGRMRTGNLEHLHITSTAFDEPECLRLLMSADFAVTVHGEDGVLDAVYLGGRDNATRERMRHSLEKRRFTVGKNTRPGLQGIDAKNICNVGKSGAGVQLEISLGLRRTLFASLTRDGRRNPTPRLALFAAAVREALLAN